MDRDIGAMSNIRRDLGSYTLPNFSTSTTKIIQEINCRS